MTKILCSNEPDKTQPNTKKEVGKMGETREMSTGNLMF
jgi:hypothetical protein